MKVFIMRLFIILVFVALSISLLGCMETYEEQSSEWNEEGEDTATKVVNIENHKYVIVRAPYSVGIVHAESCGCKH